ncbi:MAG: hypothetical protein GY754_09670 [bacterium]|nr:hypothetical protein [bacterium]
MKIIYITDIHGGFNKVSALMFDTVADVYIIAGDLIDIPFYNIDTAIHYHEMQTYFNGLRRKMEREDMILEDFVEFLMDTPNTADDILDRGAEYQNYTIRARRVMQQKYKVLENLISFKPSAMVFAIPGNYDMDLKFTSLHDRDLHLHRFNVDTEIIAGYGGADVWTAGIPEKYIVRYNAGIGVGDKKNEMYTYFKAVKPSIIVSHQPAHGIFDRLSFKGPSGSPALRTYCEKNEVKLCLTGHIHSDWGFKHSEGTIYLNPSNFGEVTTTTGDVSEGGFFFEIEIENTVVERVTLKKLANERVHDVAEYFVQNEKWIRNIIDIERYEARIKDENYDMKIQKYSHIPQIELFKDIRQFYRMFQTQETEKRVDTLEKVLKQLQEKLVDVALDIVGSVNIGISEKSSDIDIVLYLRCGSTCTSMMEHCEYFNKVKTMLKEELGEHYKFEIVDCINLNTVEHSIITQNYECETTQRFVTYRSICRPINYKLIAPIEDILNENIEFRKEMEGSIKSYFKIFVSTAQHINSFEKYETRLKTIGIKIPEYIRKKIRDYLQGNEPF